MLHFTFQAVPGTWLFRSWTEGLALWEVLHRRVPGLQHAVLMPDHGHCTHPNDVSGQLVVALRAMARVRNRLRGREGPVFSPLQPGEHVTGDKRGRVARYVPLNPCRARLVDDPLAWPLSTHRDRCGLALRPVVGRTPDPGQEHHRVSADHSCEPDGTSLPEAPERVRLPGIAPAVSSLLRVSVDALSKRGDGRSLILQTALATTDLPRAEIAAFFGVGARTVRRHADRLDARVRMVQRVTGDPRFAALTDGDLTRSTAWQRYWESHVERRLQRIRCDRRARRRPG